MNVWRQRMPALHPKTDCPVDARRSGTVNWSNGRPRLTVYANAAGEDGHIERAQKRQDATDPAIDEFVPSIYTTHRATRLRRLAEKRKAEAEAVRLSLVALAAQGPEASPTNDAAGAPCGPNCPNVPAVGTPELPRFGNRSVGACRSEPLRSQWWRPTSDANGVAHPRIVTTSRHAGSSRYRRDPYTYIQSFDSS